jgi:fructuronate reductase
MSTPSGTPARRLASDTLATVGPAVRRPDFDRSGLETGIVHLGLGAFHRAHQAVYTDGLLRRDPRWGIVGASLRSPATRDALAPQDFLYTMVERDRQGDRMRIIGALRGTVVAPEAPEDLLALMARPSVRIVSLTVTEKGYRHDPATGALDEDQPDVRHDATHSDRPRTTPGFLVAALARRREAGLPPFTVLSCDNLPSNGETTRRVVLRMAELQDRELARWVENEVAFPSTMVDRIVPATTDADRALVAATLGIEDASPVVTEPFSQWIIEDRFPAGRPAWEETGATFAMDVAPFERMKLRLLNGSHSAIAYLGRLAGYPTVADAISDPDLSRFIRAMMDEEVTPTLDLPASVDLSAYKDRLMARFANPALRHRTAQIAIDGSQKLPQRLLEPIQERIAAGAPIDRLALAVAGWMRHAAGTDEAGRSIAIDDPMGVRISALAREAGMMAARLAPALMSISEIFGKDLPHDQRFVGPVTAALERLCTTGVRKAINTDLS